MLKDLIPWRKKEEPANVPVRREEDSFTALHRHMDDMFESFFSDFEGSALTRSGFGLSPKFDVSETDKSVKVTAELPGMDQQDIDVSLDDNLLTIKGEKKEESDRKDNRYHLSERRYGSFQRSFSLPRGLDHAKVDATFKNGVLTLELPKTEVAKSKRRKIDIN